MAAAYPGPFNTFIPSHEATGKLIVDFSRNVSDFGVNKYVTLVPMTKDLAYYLQITVAEAGRIVNATDYNWPDGQIAPMGDNNLESFEFKPVYVERQAFPWTIGDIAVENADWPIVAAHARIHAQKAMTMRTLKVLTAALNTSNWDATHVATATVAGGGFWHLGTISAPYILKSLNYAANLIIQDTLAAVKGTDMLLVINPRTAQRMAESPEIREYLAQSPAALAQVKGDVPSQNGRYGLPDTLYGYKVVVEETVRITSKKGETVTKAYVMEDGKALLLSRPGSLEGIENSPSFSTLHLFVREDMKTETMHDVNNRLQAGRITERIAGYVVAPASGFLFTGLFS